MNRKSRALISNKSASFNKKKYYREKFISKRKHYDDDGDRKKSIDENEEKLLENIVFNTNVSISLKEKFIEKDQSTKDVDVPDDLFIIDRVGDQAIQLDEDDDEELPDKPSGSNNQKDDDNFGDDDDEVAAEKYKKGQFDTIPDNSKPLWEDEDDDIDAQKAFEGFNKLPKKVKSSDKYKQYLERKFTSIYEPPSWAQKALQSPKSKAKKSKHDDSESDEDEIDAIAYDKIKSKRSRLDKEFLNIKKCTHLNQSCLTKSSLDCVNFHPNSTVALVGSQMGLVRLFQVDGKLNSMIQSIHFQGFKLCDAKFISSNGREEIIVGSDGTSSKSRGYCFYYDMNVGKIIKIRLTKGGKHFYSLRSFQVSPNGSYIASCDDNGYINLMTVSSKELFQELKVNGDVNCLSFSPDSNYLLAHGQENGCQAFIFDIRNAKTSIPCINRFDDIDTIVATSMDISPTGSYVAIGSNMGVVNIYNFNDVLKLSNPKPVKSVMNLTTAIKSMKFNHDGQLLLIASDQKNDSIRFLNTNSMTVYKNFPLFVNGKDRTYGRIRDVDISPNSGYTSFVTGHGTAHLFRINEYSSY